MKKVEYGSVVSAKDAMLVADSMLPEAQNTDPQDISPIGNALWSYKFEHKINGIIVDTADRDLMIDREDLLLAAFQPVCIPRSVIFWMSPDDTEAIKKYDEILQDVYDGKIIILDELKQYDTTKCKFMVWIKYNEVRYALHPRFSYLREEAQHE